MTFVSLSFGANRECVTPLLLVESLMNLVSLIPDKKWECVWTVKSLKILWLLWVSHLVQSENVQHVLLIESLMNFVSLIPDKKWEGVWAVKSVTWRLGKTC